MKRQIQKMEEIVFDGIAISFVILDGASVPGLLGKLREFHADYECLYRGELKPDLAEAAPYLVQHHKGSEVTNWILSEGWGEHWGIFASAETPLAECAGICDVS